MFTNCQVTKSNVNPREYHDHGVARGDSVYPVSPSMLKEFARCPQRWFLGYKSPPSKSKDWGKLLDCFTLTPEQMPHQYVTEPDTYMLAEMACPECGSVSDAKKCRKCNVDRRMEMQEHAWNPRAEYCRNWRMEVEARNYTVLSREEMENVKSAHKRLMSEPIIRDFLSECDFQVLVQGEWTDEATEMVIPVRCLIDCVPHVNSEFGKSLGDLKTTTHGATARFTRDIDAFGYDLQAAFDLDLYCAATGEDRVSWHLLVQESFEPYETNPILLDQRFMELGRDKYRRALALYAKCVKSHVWPGYNSVDEAVQGWSLATPSPWMESAQLFSETFEVT